MDGNPDLRRRSRARALTHGEGQGGLIPPQDTGSSPMGDDEVLDSGASPVIPL